MKNVGIHVTKKVGNALFAAIPAFAVEMKIIQRGMEIAPPRRFKLLEKMDMTVYHQEKV